jgi:chromosome segregation ATPase
MALLAMMAIAALVLFTIGGRAAQLNRQVTSLTAEQQQLSENLARLTGEREQLQKELAELEERRVQLQAEISVLNGTLGYIRKASPKTAEDAESRAQTVARARVYIQVESDQNARVADELSRQLQQAGFVVPRIERVKAVPRQPQIRYFSSESKAEAERVLAIVRRQLPNASVVLFTPYDTPAGTRGNHLELWF